MRVDLSKIIPDFEALSPEGRWRLLQQWLDDNPEYGERVEDWSRLPAGEVFEEIADLVGERYGTIATLIIAGSKDAQERIKKAIEVLQTLYRERKDADTQEAKHETKRRAKRKDRQVRGRVAGDDRS